MSYNLRIKNCKWKKCANSFLFLFISFFLPQQVTNQSPVFIRDCNDPLIVGHPFHPYCEHPCNFLLPPSNGTITCTTGGHCACNPLCSDDPSVLAQPVNDVFGAGYCPASATTDPPDPDSTAISRCNSQCAEFCPGGVAIICGDLSDTFPSMTFAKVCSCSCPTQRCTPLLNPTESSSSPTLPVPTIINTATTNPKNSTLILIFKNPVYKIPLKIKSIVMMVVGLKYFMVAAIIALKLFAFHFLQWILIALYCSYKFVMSWISDYEF